MIRGLHSFDINLPLNYRNLHWPHWVRAFKIKAGEISNVTVKKSRDLNFFSEYTWDALMFFKCW